MFQESRLVLSLENITLAAEKVQDWDPISLEMNIYGGDLFFFQLESHSQGVAVADLCSGLITPSEGKVRFLGRRWSKLKPDTANALRGHIGRVCSSGAWNDLMTIRENILLPQLHHTRRTVQAVQEEAAHLAKSLGLPGIPSGYPSEALPFDLVRASWIRAFLGRPFLILLEEPISGEQDRGFGHLMNVIRKARDLGAAIIWLTLQQGIFQDSTIPVSRRFRLAGRKLMEVSGHEEERPASIPIR